MSTISPYSGGDWNIKSVSSTAPRVATTPAAPVSTAPTESFQMSSAASVASKPELQAAPEVTSGWASRVAGKLGEWATMLVPSPITAVASVANDVFTGAHRDSRFEYSREASSESDAQATFAAAKERLLNPNGWGELGPKLLPTSFELVSPDTRQRKEGQASVGDFLKIKLPDPGPPVWVKIEEIQDNPDSAKIVVRPSEDPTRNTPETIIHLFGEETTNVFELKRDGAKVTSSVEGHDETANMSGNLLQNAFAGARLAGAWLGAKKPQWNSFTQKLVDGPPPSLGMRIQGQVTGMATYLGLLQPDSFK